MRVYDAMHTKSNRLELFNSKLTVNFEQNDVII